MLSSSSAFKFPRVRVLLCMCSSYLESIEQPRRTTFEKKMASSDESNEQLNSSDSGRQPRNMQGLLRFAIQNTSGEPVADDNSPRFQPLDEDRRRWLEEMIATMSVNVGAVMRRAIETLTQPEAEDEVADQSVDDNKIQALDELMEWVDNMDFANDFYRIGGFSILRPCLKSNNEEIRYRTAELIAELAQNNPCCQKAAVESKLIPELTSLLNVDQCDTVRIKALYALSGILRDEPVAQEAFADCDGYSVILRSIQSTIDKLKVKASFLLSALCAERPSLKVVLCNMGYVEQLIHLIQSEHDLTHEYVFGALNAIVSENEQAIRECRRPELHFKQTLLDRLELVRAKDEFKEECECCQKLMDICFGDDVIDQEDR